MKPRNSIYPRAAQIDAVGQLHQDLLRYSVGELPTDEELEAAPFLLTWQLTQRTVPCIKGLCGKHPTRDAGFLMSSHAWWVDPTNGWARTQNRLYRLGIYSRL